MKFYLGGNSRVVAGKTNKIIQKAPAFLFSLRRVESVEAELFDRILSPLEFPCPRRRGGFYLSVNTVGQKFAIFFDARVQQPRGFSS